MLEYVSIVDKGLIHKTNDDATLVNRNIIHEGIYSGKTEMDCGIFAVADGVGGKPGSEIAARIALKTISECSPFDEVKLVDQIIEANECILDEIYLKKPEKGYSTTLCIVSVCRNNIYSINIGNSRLYHFRNDKIEQLTKDRTVAFDWYEKGIISYDELLNHDKANVLTTYLGVDNFSKEWIDINRYDFELNSESILLLCSDGITNYISDDTLKNVLASSNSLIHKAQRIIDLANQKGGRDNQSIILIKGQY